MDQQTEQDALWNSLVEAFPSAEELIYKTSMQHDDAVIAASTAMINRKDYSDRSS